MRILDNQVSCGCMIAKLDKQELLHGETLNATITTSIPITLAKRSLIASLKTDSIEKPEIVFEIRYTAVPRLHSESGAIDFGSITEDSTGDSEFDLVIRRHYLPDEKDQCDLFVKSSSSYLDSSVEKRPETETEYDSRSNNWVVKVVLKEDAKKRTGPQSELVEIGLETGEIIKIPVTWTCKSNKTMLPAVVNFGLITRGEMSDVKRISIHFLPGRYKKVRSITTEDCIIYAADMCNETTQVWNLRLDSTKSRVDGYQSGKLIFDFEDGSSMEGRWFGSITSGS